MKAKLRLTSEELAEPPAPLRFPRAGEPLPEGVKAPTLGDTVAGVEAAMQDAQNRLNKLRAIVFPGNPNDDGPCAA